MNVVVMGAGSLGCFYGGLLARAGHHVAFIARGSILEALQTRGIQVRSKLAGDFAFPVEATSNPAELESPDVVLLSVKAYDLDEAANAIAPIVGPDSLVVAIQNGIDHQQRLAQYLPGTQIAPGMVYVSATVESPGVVVQPGGPGTIRLGLAYPEQRAGLDAIVSAFRDAPIECVVLEEYQPELWTKFMYICAMSGASALTRLTLRQMFAVRESRAFYRDIMTEVAAVAIASGIGLQEGAADDAMETLLTMDALPEKGSMAYDLAAGKRIEIETLNGTVTRLGSDLGVHVPMNRAVYAALKPFEDGPPSTSG